MSSHILGPSEVYTDIVPQALAHYGIEYEVDGEAAKACCPFHDENTPSFYIFFESGYFRCYGCGLAGPFAEFLTRMEKDDEIAAMRLHRQFKNGGATSDPRVREGIEKKRDEEVVDFREVFARYHDVNWDNLPDSHPVIEYFVGKRGLTRATLSAFKIRLTGNEDYPACIPVFRDGEIMGYVKRYVGDDPQMKRYLYNKGFNGREAMAYHAFGHDVPLLIVEGMMDYLKAAQFGAQAAAAILGWEIKPAQVSFIKRRGFNRVVCALDNPAVSPSGLEGCDRLTQYFKVRRFGYPGDHAKDIADLNINEYWKGYIEATEGF